MVRTRQKAVVIAACFALVLVAAAALVEWGPHPVRYESEGSLAYVADAESCYLGLAPNTRARQRKVSDLGTLSWTVRTDRYGFRIPDAEPPPESLPSPDCRLLCLGDSFTIGSWVEAEQTWPAALQRALHARGFRQVRTYNGGFLGATIAQERLAAARWRDLSAGVVVLQTTRNDFEDLARMQEASCRFGEDAPRLQTVGSAAALEEPLTYVVGAGGRPPNPALSGTCDDLRALYLEELRSLADELDDDTELLVAEFETPHCESPHPVPWSFGRAVRDDAVRHLEVREAPSTRPVRLTPLDSHPSPHGYALFAEAVARELADTGWLERCR